MDKPIQTIAGLVTILVGGFAAYTFFTGNISISEEERNSNRNVESVQPKIEGGGVIGKVNINDFRPLYWLPAANDGAQTMYAVEPASGALWWHNPSWIVSLTCRADHSCVGNRLFPVEAQIGYVDTLTPSVSGEQLLALNREGVGAIFSFAAQRFSYFQFELPCARRANYEDAGGGRESQYSTQVVNFSDDEIQIRLQGVNCAGTARVQNQRFEISGHAPGWVNSDRYYELLVTLNFAGGYVASSDIKKLRYEFNNRVPSWFRWASRIPSEPETIAFERSDKWHRIASALAPLAGERLHIIPDIPPHVLDGAMSAGELDLRDLVAVYDMSLNFDGVDGAFFTTEGIASRFSALERKWAPYDRLDATPKRDGYYVKYGNAQVVLAPLNAFATVIPEEDLTRAVETARAAAMAPAPPAYVASTAPVEAEAWPADATGVIQPSDVMGGALASRPD